jgi:hypothetical protein
LQAAAETIDGKCATDRDSEAKADNQSKIAQEDESPEWSATNAKQNAKDAGSQSPNDHDSAVEKFTHAGSDPNTDNQSRPYAVDESMDNTD